MTTDLAIIPQLHESLALSSPDREAAEAVASGLRDVKAANTRRSSASAWRRFQERAEAGDHTVLPSTPQAVALYLGHLAAGRSMATIEQARAALSHFHAAAGVQKGDNPARHPMVAEAMRGWRNRAPAPRQADALTSDALARVREVFRLPKRGRGGRMESAETAHKRAALDLAIIGVMADGGLRRSEAAARAAGLGEGFTGHSGRIGMARRMVAAWAPNAAVQREGRWKHGDMVARYTRGESAE